ncbi:Serine/threonine protein kinase [Nonomuraea maritima]|uniref:non-specific serine/threonine protein kinase n=1 Tax=Nonomuraea maritima TaxID=683260 RepID=A0A1G9G128_9ACTN|nr:serine/threonine-protein kinase [Nonomuraea maritima]SDK94346.1 Serine/threonine protein kinase [Nonomuraea maritima]
MAADRLLSGSGPDGGAGGAPKGQGRLIGRRYRLVSPVGRGGMGVVWQAHDVLLDRDVAVKELILPYGLDQAGLQVAHRRVLREARSAARLQHPGIVTVHDVVEEDGRPWIVMELVRAWSLEQAVRQSGPLPVVQAAEIGIRVLDALRHAHAAGILHRDIKPGNVLLTADRVVLTDFGIAAVEGDVTITQTGLLMGSPAYIPPERLSGQQITQAADLWSFGATLYAAVEGRPPYEGPDAVAVLGSVLTRDPIRPQRAGALLPVVEGLLRKNPAERMTSEQAAQLLEDVLRTHGAALPRRPDTLPGPADPTPAGLLPPLETPSGPMPSRIVETPSGPVRVPYESGSYTLPPTASPPGGAPADPPSGSYDAPAGSWGGYDSLSSPSGGVPRSPLGAPTGLGTGRDFRDDTPGLRTGPQPGSQPGSQTGPQLGSQTGPQTGPQLGPRTGPQPQPILPLTSDSRTSGATPWPLASPADLSEQSRDAYSRDTGRDTGRDSGRDTGQNRPAAPPDTAPRTGRSRRRKEQDDGFWAREGRPAPMLLIGALVAVAAVTAAVLFLLVRSDDPPPAAGLDADTSETTAVGTEPSAIPEGYQEHSGRGFAAATPDDWKPSTSGRTTRFDGPKDSGLRILVEPSTPQPDGGLSVLAKKEAAGGLESYIQVRLQAVNYRGTKAADWEYTYTSDKGVPMHALVRHATMDGAAFLITFDLPQLKWDDQAETRKTFLDTFQHID